MARSVVMVVDANPATSRNVRRALQGTEIEVLSVDGMSQAVERSNDPELVAILSAISIPGGNGYELTRRVVELNASMAVFLLWGGFEPLDQGRATSAGVRAGLRRPFSSEALLALLEELLGAVPVSSSAIEPVEPVEPVEPFEEDLPLGSIEPLDANGGGVAAYPTPPVGDERLASFVPADYDEIPPMRVDREELSVALERAVLAVLPEVLEAVLNKAVTQPGRARAIIDQVVAAAVAERLPAVLERSLRERLGEGDQG